jgi:hypothetical protein
MDNQSFKRKNWFGAEARQCWYTGGPWQSANAKWLSFEQSCPRFPRPAWGCIAAAALMTNGAGSRVCMPMSHDYSSDSDFAVATLKAVAL